MWTTGDTLGDGENTVVTFQGAQLNKGERRLRAVVHLDDGATDMNTNNNELESKVRCADE